MTQSPQGAGDPGEFSNEELAAFGAYLPELRRSLSDQRILRTYLVIAFAVGLIAQTAGYLLRPVATAEPFGLLVDLVYAFGLALWTGVVVAVFSQVLPEAKRRQVERAIAAVEASRRGKR